MANYTTTEEISVDAEIVLDVAVFDEHGNEVECLLEGVGFSLTAHIDTAAIKENMLDEVREDLKEELREEFKADLYKEIATTKSPINTLSAMLILIGIEHDKFNNETNEIRSKSSTRMMEQSEEIETLKRDLLGQREVIDTLKGEALARAKQPHGLLLDLQSPTDTMFKLAVSEDTDPC